MLSRSWYGLKNRVVGDSDAPVITNMQLHLAQSFNGGFDINDMPNNSQITSWDDVGPNKWHARQFSGTAVTNISDIGVDFTDGTILNNTQNWMITTQKWTFFIVYTATTSAAPAFLIGNELNLSQYGIGFSQGANADNFPDFRRYWALLSRLNSSSNDFGTELIALGNDDTIPTSPNKYIVGYRYEVTQSSYIENSYWNGNSGYFSNWDHSFLGEWPISTKGYKVGTNGVDTFQGTINEVILYDNNLTDQQVTDTFLYLNTKHNVY